MTILNTLPARPWKLEEYPDGSWEIYAADKTVVSASHLLGVFDDPQAQALVTAINSFGAMVGALRGTTALLRDYMTSPGEEDQNHAEVLAKARAALALIEEGK